MSEADWVVNLRLLMTVMVRCCPLLAGLSVAPMWPQRSRRAPMLQRCGPSASRTATAGRARRFRRSSRLLQFSLIRAQPEKATNPQLRTPLRRVAPGCPTGDSRYPLWMLVGDTTRPDRMAPVTPRERRCYQVDGKVRPSALTTGSWASCPGGEPCWRLIGLTSRTDQPTAMYVRPLVHAPKC